MQNSNIFAKLIILAIFVSTNAYAQLRPWPDQPGSGKPSNDPNRPAPYQPRPEPPPHRPHPQPAPYYPPQPNYPPHPRPHQPPPPNPYYPPQPPPHHQPPPNPYYPPQPPPPPPPPMHYPGERVIEPLYIGRSTANESLALFYLSRLANRYSGWQVVAIRANTVPNSPYRTVARLVSSQGRVFASQTNPGRQINLIPTSLIRVGYDELFLQISGSTYINQIEIEMMYR